MNKHLVISSTFLLPFVDDSRIRTIPFPTRRPTFNEVKRVHQELSSVQLLGKSHLCYYTNYEIWFREEATSALTVFHTVLYPDRVGISRFWFLRREKIWRTRRKMHWARQEPATNSTHLRHRAGIESRSQWWEAGTLTTAPSLFPVHKSTVYVK